MFFVYNNSFIKDVTAAAKVKTNAYHTIMLYQPTIRDEQLSDYLYKHYGTDFKTSCLLVWHNAKYSYDADHNIIVSFIDKYYDTLAKLITFGAAGIKGSSILRLAFSRK